jgi:hypothetical protein
MVCRLNDVAWYADDSKDSYINCDREGGSFKLVSLIEGELSPSPRRLLKRLDEAF